MWHKKGASSRLAAERLFFVYDSRTQLSNSTAGTQKPFSIMSRIHIGNGEDSASILDGLLPKMLG